MKFTSSNRESYIKDDLKWISDGEISYVPKRVYKFFPRESRPNRQIDKITTINIPMIVRILIQAFDTQPYQILIYFILKNRQHCSN